MCATHTTQRSVQARELLEAMSSMRYAAVFPALEALQPQLAIDPLLVTCLPDLRDALRRRVLQQYVAPYHALRLPDMAADLGTTVAALQPELVALVASGEIEARVDSVAKVRAPSGVCCVLPWALLQKGENGTERPRRGCRCCTGARQTTRRVANRWC